MKFLRVVLAILAVIFILLMAIITPVAWLGLLVLLFGLYQGAQKRKGKLTFSRPGFFVFAGLLITFIAAIMSPTAQVEKESQQVSGNNVEKTVDNSKNSEKQEEVVKAEEAKKQKEAAKAEEVKKQEEAAKAEEAKKQEEVAKAEEAKKREEAAKAEEAKKQEELINSMNLEQVLVARVVDGDTLELNDGRKVRLIGVNTPESTTRTEEYGKEASKYTTEQLEGKKVWIQKDISETDRYSRYLRIVWTQVPKNDMAEEEIRNKMFNAQLVLNGYAEPSTYPPDVKYSQYFKDFAMEARDENKGLWAFGENGTTKGDLDPKETTSKSPSASERSNTSTSNNSESVGNNSSTSTINTEEVVEEQPAQSSTEFFQNCTELRKVYPSGVPSDHPAYAPKHDRDKDNWACES
ncbi:thermonuclease family protein [Priestia flexa]|uniref:thermonuclease family protein n=1 Tax=Priestia flexa TaxID=86664 RepID=UPI00288D8E65|nr:thermonuclease family protein [Priestia flexa]MDT2048031.1 thermonuclease family protein [Priestia flexa]